MDDVSTTRLTPAALAARSVRSVPSTAGLIYGLMIWWVLFSDLEPMPICNTNSNGVGFAAVG